MLLQLPSHFPHPNAPHPATWTAHAAQSSDQNAPIEVQASVNSSSRVYVDKLAQEMFQTNYSDNLEALGSGFIGELLITRAGKMKMKLGAVLLDVYKPF